MALGDAASRAERELGAYRGGGDVGEIGGNTGSVDNIVQSQLVDERTGLEEEGQRLVAKRCAVSFGGPIYADYKRESREGRRRKFIPVQYLRRHQQQLLRQTGQYHGLHAKTISHDASS